MFVCPIKNFFFGQLYLSLSSKVVSYQHHHHQNHHLILKIANCDESIFVFMMIRMIIMSASDQLFPFSLLRKRFSDSNQLFSISLFLLDQHRHHHPPSLFLHHHYHHLSLSLCKEGTTKIGENEGYKRI